MLRKVWTYVLLLGALTFNSEASRISIKTFSEIAEEYRVILTKNAQTQAQMVKELTKFNPKQSENLRIHVRTVPRDTIQSMQTPSGKPFIFPLDVQKEECRMNALYFDSVDATSLGVKLLQMQHAEELLRALNDFPNIYPLVLGSRGLRDLEFIMRKSKRFNMPWSGVFGVCDEFNKKNSKSWGELLPLYQGFLDKYPDTLANVYLSTLSKSPFTGQVFTPAHSAQKALELYDIGFKKVIFSDTAADFREPQSTYAYLKEFKEEGQKHHQDFFKKSGIHTHGPMAPVNTAIAACLGINHIEISMIPIEDSGGCPTVVKERGPLENASGVETIALLWELGFCPPITTCEAIKLMAQSPAGNYYFSYSKDQK